MTFSLNFHNILMISLFVIGYLAIAFEHVLKINKTATALVMAVALWTLHFLGDNLSLYEDLRQFHHHLSDISGLIFFLLGSMAIVELIDAHHGFKIITDFIRTRSKRKMLWLTSFICFFLSAVLDNLTTTIVMISLLRKLIPEREDRLIFGSMVVIAANAGGCWTPIGDVTTTMLWMEERISTYKIMQGLFVPAVISILFSLAYQSVLIKGLFPSSTVDKNPARKVSTTEPNGTLIFFVGVACLISVPIFKSLTGLPVFVGTLLGLGILWIITDLLHHKDEERNHLRMPHVLSKVDISGVLFFLGILLAVASLDTVGALRALAQTLSHHITDMNVIAILIGLFSAIVDNVPLVAASMSMYSKAQFPMDHTFWELLAYTAGTGGSILIIGSAAGVAFMGMEKVDFFWYVRKITPVAALGYFAGAASYLLMGYFF